MEARNCVPHVTIVLRALVTDHESNPGLGATKRLRASTEEQTLGDSLDGELLSNTTRCPMAHVDFPWRGDT